MTQPGQPLCADALAKVPLVRIGLSAQFGVLVAPEGTAASDESLAQHVATYFQDVADVALSTAPACEGSAVVLWQGAPSAAPFVLVRGVPLGVAGEAADDEIRAALADPRSCSLAGVWSIASVSASEVRITTSRAPVHVLAEASGPRGTAWASRNDLAVLLSGSGFRLARERVPEYLTLDYVLGPDELLDQGQVLAEGAIVDVRRAGGRTTWNRAERPISFTDSGETTGDQLREVVTEYATRCGRVDDAMLALTAGRDSSLLLSCMARENAVPVTFTMGWRGLPDARGAAAVARAVGAPHHVTVTEAHDGSPIDSLRSTRAWIQKQSRGPAAGAEMFEPILRWTRWTQGLDHPRNLLMGWIRWPAGNLTVITGSGGEIGRAFYWHRGVDQSAADLLTEGWRDVLHPDAWSNYRARIESELATLADGLDAASALDLIYVRGRMRKWLNRGAAFREVRGTLFPYLEPEVVTALLAIPRERRFDGSVFDAALAAADVNLHHLGRANSRPRRWSGPRNPLNRWLSTLPSDWPLLSALATHCTSLSDLHEQVFRRDWFERALATGATDPSVRPLLWNYVAVVAAEQIWEGSMRTL